MGQTKKGFNQAYSRAAVIAFNLEKGINKEGQIEELQEMLDLILEDYAKVMADLTVAQKDLKKAEERNEYLEAVAEVALKYGK